MSALGGMMGTTDNRPRGPIAPSGPRRRGQGRPLPSPNPPRWAPFLRSVVAGGRLPADGARPPRSPRDGSHTATEERSRPGPAPGPGGGRRPPPDVSGRRRRAGRGSYASTRRPADTPTASPPRRGRRVGSLEGV